jgi:hypothetical protein
MYNALVLSSENIIYKRFKREFILFLNNYELNNFNIIRATEEISKKFDCYEFKMFINILIEADKKGKIYDTLVLFDKTLEISYYKYLKYKQFKRIIFIILSCIISLINIVMITVYPIFIQISENLQNIFK